MSEVSSPGVSPSVQSALDWASAVARVRERTPPGDPDPIGTPMDLLVGAMLSHADPDGEVRVLLSHFGLTARDVVGEEYGSITPESLAAAAAYASPGRVYPDAPVAQIIGWAGQYGRGYTQLLHVVGGMLSAQTELMTRLETAFTYIGESRQVVAASYEEWLRGSPQQHGIAGQSLRTWLQEHNPRTAVSVAGFATDDVAGPELQQADLVGISPEANALAYLVSSRDLAPPLAVGLFGDWGSGKSFLMRDVRRRVNGLLKLCADQPQHESAIWKNVEHIEFNAWEYVHDDLWAGLLERIFERLGRKIPQDSLLDQRRAPLRLQLAQQQAVVRAAEHEARAWVENLEYATAEVAAARRALADRKNELAQAEVNLSTDANAALRNFWSGEEVERVTGDVVSLADAVREGWAEAQQLRAWLVPYLRDRRRLTLLVGGVVAGPLLLLGLSWLASWSRTWSVVMALTGAVPAITTGVVKFTIWSRRNRTGFARARQEVLEPYLEEVKAEEDALGRAKAAENEAQQAAAQRSADLTQEQQRERALGEELLALTAGRVFAEFADRRSAEYGSKLGVLGSVREDLRTIEKAITENNRLLAVAPATPPTPDPEPTAPDETMPNRIILYIDDLDRCPPAKVVQVLEAVHLLLAFQLFVVFVAVDSRWLSSALIEELHALRVVRRELWPKPKDNPEPRDYLEKIFQLPFWVQPLSADDRVNIVAGLLAPTVRTESTGEGGGGRDRLRVAKDETEALDEMLAQGGSGLRLETSALALTPAELEFITGLGPLLGKTPRRIKRFVNTVQFLLSIRPPLASNAERPPRLAVALFAAIHEGLPSIAKELFKEANSDRPLESVLGEPRIDSAERKVMEEWLVEPGHEWWKAVETREIGERREMVQRLGFDRPVS